MQFEVMPIGKAPVLGTGESRFDSGHLDHARYCPMTRLVSRLACRASEAGSKPAWGALTNLPIVPNGVVQKAANLPCKQVFSERYRAIPPAPL